MKRFGVNTAALLLAVFAGSAHAELPPPVQQALQAAQIPVSHVAVVVQPVDGRAPLLSHNARAAMNPASVMKLLTTYAALELLGPAHSWKTGAWSEAATVDGVLNGNLTLKGGGDPRFAIEHLWSLLRQLRVRGIRHIAGDIVLDRSAFAISEIDPGAFDDKPMRPYNVGPDALLLNFRALRFSFIADGGQQPRVLQETPSEGLRLDNQLRYGDGPCPRQWPDQIQSKLQAEPGGNGWRLVFTGSYSRQCGEKSLNLAPLAADAQADGLLRALWSELGGSLGGRVRSGTLPPGARLLSEHESPPLADAVRDINKFSNNVMARHLYLALGNGNGEVATTERARQRLDDWLRQQRLDFPELVVDNGSGLSRQERISADSLNRLLQAAWNSPTMPEFIASLPIVGIDGTMKRRLKDSAATGRAHIKTGTLDGVKTAAGYALDAQGRRYSVSFLINHPKAQAGSAAIDALLLWLAQRRDKTEAGRRGGD